MPPTAPPQVAMAMSMAVITRPSGMRLCLAMPTTRHEPRSNTSASYSQPFQAGLGG